MSQVNVLIYRIHALLKQAGAGSALRRLPGIGRGLDRIKHLARRHLLRNTTVWVRIEFGLSQGLWMQVRLPQELGVWRGQHEPEVQKAILAIVRRGDVVYDVGCHIGTISLGTAKLVGAAGLVVAFDGDPENVKRLKLNRARNGLEDRLEVVHTAVWSRTTNDGICFRRGTTFKSHGGVDDDGQHPVLATGEIIKVRAITLDDFVSGGGSPPRLVKIDVEGGEYEVLLGGSRLFETHRTLVIIEIHSQQAAEQIRVWLTKFRYEAQWNIPAEGLPICLFAWPTEQDGVAWMRDTQTLHNKPNRI